VVERFAQQGAAMFNTAEDGAVFVETDGTSVTLRAWSTGRTRSWSMPAPTAQQHHEKDTRK
jgi:beta-lactamase superfamily II metal-dependent hydrolase